MPFLLGSATTIRDPITTAEITAAEHRKTAPGVTFPFGMIRGGHAPVANSNVSGTSFLNIANGPRLLAEGEREPELPSSASVDAVCIYPREVKLALLFRATRVCEVQSSRLSRISLLARIVSRVDVSNTKRSDEMNLDDSLFASRPDVMRLICWQRVEGSGF